MKLNAIITSEMSLLVLQYTKLCNTWIYCHIFYLAVYCWLSIINKYNNRVKKKRFIDTTQEYILLCMN